MEKFNVEIDGFPKRVIVANDANEAGWEYCVDQKVIEQILRNSNGYECVSVRDEKGQTTKFKASIINRHFEFTKLQEAYHDFC